MSRLAPLFAAALLLLAPGCGSTPSPGVDRAEVSRVVSQVMSPQVRIGVREKLQALEELETFLMATERRSEQVARALTQLADLYLTVELSTYERAVSRYNREPSGTPPTLNHDRSIRIYEKVLADYPKRPRNHTVRYQLARAYDDLGHFESEVAMLEGLLRRHPTSEYALEATYRLGELAFDDGRLQHAVKYYDRVLKKSPEGELADYAAYKRTWSLYLMPDPDRAARAAVAFIDSRRVRRGGRLMLSSDAMPEPDWERVREILTLLARVLHEQGGARALARYLPEHRDYLHQVYRKLGEVSVQMGNPAGAIATYEAFLSRFPNDSQAPSVLGQVVDIHTDQGDVDSAVAVRARLVDEYGPKSDWWSHQSAAVRRTVGPAIEKTVHQLARHYHSVAQESGAKADYDRAVHWYNRYLREYPNVAAAPGTVFLIGEALFEAGDYSGAAFAYRRSAYDYPRHKKSGEAAYAQVYALERYLSEAKPGSATYRERLAALSDAFKSLVSAYPREPRLPQAYERITGLLFEQGDHNTLYEVADHVIRYGPRLRDLHARAWRTFGEAAFETGRYDTAEEALGKALTILQGDANASPETISELKKLLAVNAISRAEEEGGGADALLKAVALVDPDDPLAEPARFDVAMALFRDDRLEEALQSFGDYGVAYPDSHRIGQVAQTVLAVGERALELGDTELARRAWARYREWFGGVDSARDLVVVGLEARAYLEEGDLAAADEAFAGLLSRYSDGMAPEELVDRLAGVRFKRAVALIESGDESGVQLLASIADELPGSRVAAAALEAVITASREKFANPERAVDAADALLLRYPDEAAAGRVQPVYMDLLIEAGRKEDAALYLTERAAGQRDPEKLEADLRAAATLYEETGNIPMATDLYRSLRDRYPTGSDGWVRESLALIHLEVAGSTRLPEPIHAADLYDQVEQAVLDLLTPMRDGDDLGPAGRFAAGRILLRRAEAAREAFATIPLVPPLKENLAKKRAALKTALAAFAEAGAFRSRDVTLSATRQTGEMYEAFALAILASPAPENLNEAQVEIYVKALKKRAAPYMERALASHERNLKRAREGIVGKDVSLSLAALGRLKPEWYDRPEHDAQPLHIK